MGPRYIEPILLDLRGIVDESTSKSPLVCLLTAGADPSSSIEEVAKKMGLGNYYK